MLTQSSCKVDARWECPHEVGMAMRGGNGHARWMWSENALWCGMVMRGGCEVRNALWCGMVMQGGCKVGMVMQGGNGHMRWGMWGGNGHMRWTWGENAHTRWDGHMRWMWGGNGHMRWMRDENAHVRWEWSCKVRYTRWGMRGEVREVRAT